MWSDQLAALSDGALVLAPDLPGFGAAAGLHPPEDLDVMAGIIYEDIRAEGVERAVVAGCSMGGYLAFALLRVAPEFIRALALVNTKAAADTEEGRAKRLDLARRVEREGCGFLQQEWPPGALCASTLAEQPEVVQRVQEMIAAATPQGVIAAQFAMAARPDSTPLLASIGVPCVVIHGLDDTIVPASEAQAMAGAIRGAKFVGVPGAGHLPNLERPCAVTGALRSLWGGIA
jgi:3-oxoadipate enol-lactonase